MVAAAFYPARAVSPRWEDAALLPGCVGPGLPWVGCIPESSLPAGRGVCGMDADRDGTGGGLPWGAWWVP